MSKSIARIHKEIQYNKPVFKAARKVMKWYTEHPVTPVAIASKIEDLKEIAEAQEEILEKAQTEELMPMLQKVEAARKAIDEAKKEAIEIGKRHQQQKEDLVTAFATLEYQLVSGELTEVPNEIRPVDSKPGKLWGFLAKITGYQQ